MTKMTDLPELSKDQLVRIAATLKRIRAGLDEATPTILPEPSHIFIPPAQEAK